MAITTVPVHGTVKLADGTLAAGATLSFALKAAITDGVSIVSIEPVVATAASDGTFTQDLYATDDSSTLPTGSYYTVTINPAGKNWIVIDQFNFVLPAADSAGVDLFALAQLTDLTLQNPYVSQIVAGTGMALSPLNGTGMVTISYDGSVAPSNIDGGTPASSGSGNFDGGTP